LASILLKLPSIPGFLCPNQPSDPSKKFAMYSNASTRNLSLPLSVKDFLILKLLDRGPGSRTESSDHSLTIQGGVARKLVPLIVKTQEKARPIPPSTKQVLIKDPAAVHGTKAAGEVIRRKELCRITGLSMTTLWRQEREGYFPARIRLTNHSVGWRRSEVEAWLATRPTA
jgi:prophage regulatory protein